MGTVIFVVILACLFLLFGVVMVRRKKSGDEPATFVCEDCGEKDCICHLEEPD